MNILKKTAATAAAAALLIGVGVATASPAAADPWLHPDKVWSISDPKTARSVESVLGTVQVRYGTYQGRQYGWGRLLDSWPGRTLLFEVDTDGDRSPDTTSQATYSSGAVWTYGYPTSSSSDRAFRACIEPKSGGGCKAAKYRTPWW